MAVDGRPTIGITADVARDAKGRVRHQVAAAYVEAVVAAGGLPLVLPADDAIRADLLRSVDGVVMTGGDDIDMRAFGVPLHAQAQPMDPVRQSAEFALLRALDRAPRMPVLGICLGMQLVARESFEHGHHEGLGWVDARIERLAPAGGLKVPHVGWNSLRFPAGDWLFEGVNPTEANFYFVHSYHMVCADPSDRLATTDYGGEVTAVVRRGDLTVMQFHPEKSQDNGLRLLGNWVRRYA